MNKKLQIIWWILLAVIIIAVAFLMFWWSANRINENTAISLEQTWDSNNPTETIDLEAIDFEQDVMTDLEEFFEWWNGYEEIQWDFWFINPNAE